MKEFDSSCVFSSYEINVFVQSNMGNMGNEIHI